MNTRSADDVVLRIGEFHFSGSCKFVDAAEAATSSADLGEVSSRNVAAGRELLIANGFRIAAEHAGGAGSRLLVFELWSGDVWIRRGQAIAPPSLVA